MPERIVLEGFKPYIGKHCETTALKRVLDYHGLSLSEEMLLGLGGGISFIYWYMKMMPSPFIGGRYGKGPDFPKDICCRIGGEATAVETGSAKRGYEELKALGVRVLAMSTDSRFVHKIWQEQELSRMVEGGVPFPMLSDAGGKVGAIYGVYDDAAGVNIRGRFIIDPDFVIRAMEVLTPEVGRSPEELVRQIKAFQHVRATGEVTPSGWQPGQVTLKPGPALVGKVWEVWKP